MSKKFDVMKELTKVQETLSEVGEILSEPFHIRAKELIVRLSKFKGVKIERMVMGMGGWSLVGTLPFKEVWRGGVEEGDHEIDLYQFETGRNCWMEYYDAVNPGISAVCAELNEICEVLTNEQHLQIFDITEKQMKELLKCK